MVLRNLRVVCEKRRPPFEHLNVAMHKVEHGCNCGGLSFLMPPAADNNMCDSENCIASGCSDTW